MAGAVLASNLIISRINVMIPPRLAIAGGSALMALACLALLGSREGTSSSGIIIQFIAMGGGLGLLVPPLTSMLLGRVDKSRSGIASGVLSSMRQIGSVLGVALFGSLISTRQLIAGVHLSLIISIALLTIGLITMISLDTRRGAATRPEDR
jgi:DHA2 family methylenomycin A resistance protein-like MFS transporter